MAENVKSENMHKLNYLLCWKKKNKQKERGRLEDHVNWQQTEIKCNDSIVFFLNYKGQLVEMLVYVRVKAAQMLQRHLHVSFFLQKWCFFPAKTIATAFYRKSQRSSTP